jgi:hypothetical protein
MDPSQQDKGYYASQPPQYPQQAMPAYGQPAYGQAASYQPQPGYPPQQPYGQPGYPQSPAPPGGYYAQGNDLFLFILLKGTSQKQIPLYDALTNNNNNPLLIFTSLSPACDHPAAGTPTPAEQ